MFLISIIILAIVVMLIIGKFSWYLSILEYCVILKAMCSSEVVIKKKLLRFWNKWVIYEGRICVVVYAISLCYCYLLFFWPELLIISLSLYFKVVLGWLLHNLSCNANVLDPIMSFRCHDYDLPCGHYVIICLILVRVGRRLVPCG